MAVGQSEARQAGRNRQRHASGPVSQDTQNDVANQAGKSPTTRIAMPTWTPLTCGPHLLCQQAKRGQMANVPAEIRMG
jgi:hypothetical protein